MRSARRARVAAPFPSGVAYGALNAARFSASLRPLVYSHHVTSDAERLARLETMLANLVADVTEHHRAVMEQIEGGPNLRRAESIRGRLHVLEGERAAANAAARALGEAQRERRVAQAERVRAESRGRVQLWRWITAAIATAAILAPYVDRALG